jgi:lysophospholipase L1-like esterase
VLAVQGRIHEEANMKRKPILLLLAFICCGGSGILAQQQAPTTNAPADAQHSCPQAEVLQKRLQEQNERLTDWPWLRRYRDADATIGPPANDEARVVFLGDSITDGWQEPPAGGFFPGKPYVNRGIGGQTTPQMLIRFRPDVIGLQPRVVVILAGTNDIAGNTGPMTLEEIEGNLASMSELAHVHGIRVVLSSVMPVLDATTPEGKKVQTLRRPPEKILSLNAWIKKYTAEHHDVYLDYFAAMVDENGFLKSALTYDGLHPNAAGYAVMAPLAEKAIQEALVKSL